jgi:hypothetical protein
MMSYKKLGLTLAVLLSGLYLIAPASAAPIHYTFTSGPLTSATGTGIGLFGADAYVTGSFTYDPDGAYLSTGTNGAGSVYTGFDNLVGEVAGHSFSDAASYTIVNDEIFFVQNSPTTATPVFRDLLNLGAGPLGEPFFGFSIDSQALYRVRLIWAEGLLGTPDFLSGNGLPSELPNFAGRVDLDFGPLSDFGSQAGVVSFNNLVVTSVPEPATWMLMALGLLAFAAFNPKRRQGLSPVAAKSLQV